MERSEFFKQDILYLVVQMYVFYFLVFVFVVVFGFFLGGGVSFSESLAGPSVDPSTLHFMLYVHVNLTYILM